MGAWGTGTFENDDALDWLGEFVRSGPSSIEFALEAVAAEAEGGYIEAPAASMALAACEIVAAAQGQPRDPWPVSMADADEVRLRELVGALNPTDDTVRRCRVAVDMVVGDTETSELFGLWDDAGPSDTQAFLSEVQDLQARLGAAAQ